MNTLCLLLTALSVWNYPSRQQSHQRLSREFTGAVAVLDIPRMESVAARGVALLPEDPTWRFNHACALAYMKGREEEAFDELERAIDCGFRNRDKILSDADLRQLERFPRYRELVEYAGKMASEPVAEGPLAVEPAVGLFGRPVTLGARNLLWDFDQGCFMAIMRLSAADGGFTNNVGDLYVNRDRQHSPLDLRAFPLVTPVAFDAEGCRRGFDASFPNTLFPYPVFGNASLAFTQGPSWRSLPRAMMTNESGLIGRMERFYRANQVWVFPANADIAPVGTNGDLFASITPYWIATAGRSYSDMPYLRAALEASGAFKPETKALMVARGLLAPTIMTLIRKSLRGVEGEEDYLSPKAHPTAFPAGGVDLARLKLAAAALEPAEVPPVVEIEVMTPPLRKRPDLPELTYSSAHAWAFLLRAEEKERIFLVRAKGARTFEFVQTHGENVDVRISRIQPDLVKVTLNREGLSSTNRVDIAVFGRNASGGWGAPSYLSIARIEPDAPYVDPVLMPRRPADDRTEGRP